MANIFKEDGVPAFRALCNDSHKLQHLKIVELYTDSELVGNNESYFILTKKGENMLLSEFDVNIKKKKDYQGIINYRDIQKKALYFTHNNQQTIDVLYSILQEKAFRNIQRRLKQNNMPIGFTCLFYGIPGTGKTETVMQLSKATGRDIMMVDISSSRNKWYGDTEKLVKKIFSDYRDYAKSKNKKPILLFNEADAIFSVRQTIHEEVRSVDKTENTIQNILLQEMEQFDGILIATTNLMENFDNAFERRFLYKINFEKPNETVRQQIWQSLLSSLSYKEIQLLSKEFDLNGAQISNIVRKSIVSEVLFGTKPNFLDLKKLCLDEKIYKDKTIGKIGYV